MVIFDPPLIYSRLEPTINQPLSFLLLRPVLILLFILPIPVCPTLGNTGLNTTRVILAVS